MITNELKSKILAEAKNARKNFTGSDAKFAVTLGISASQYSRVMSGQIDKVLSDANWISIARKLNVALNDAPRWEVANTPVFQYITAQLQKCQAEGISSLLCDFSDIGKSFAAKHYAKNNKNAIYVDCSQVKSKQKLIRYIAKEFGVENNGKYAEVYEDLVFYLKTLNHPIIILDEAGDLQYDAFLEVKALWNATENYCGFYMMGADGLKEKMHRAINNRKVGYTEIFSRFGKRYGRVIPIDKAESDKLLHTTAAMIIKANSSGNVDVNQLLRRTIGEDGRPSLRRIHTELSKVR